MRRTIRRRVLRKGGVLAASKTTEESQKHREVFISRRFYGKGFKRAIDAPGIENSVLFVNFVCNTISYRTNRMHMFNDLLNRLCKKRCVEHALQLSRGTE